MRRPWQGRSTLAASVLQLALIQPGPVGSVGAPDALHHLKRAIGWWVKERYRAMRGYNWEQSVLNVSHLIAVMDNAVAGGKVAISQDGTVRPRLFLFSGSPRQSPDPRRVMPNSARRTSASMLSALITIAARN
jgi:hypothetical protein